MLDDCNKRSKFIASRLAATGEKEIKQAFEHSLR